MSNVPTDLSAGVDALGAGGLLEFEKPLQRIQYDVAEMEREQSETGRGLGKEIKQQRTRLRNTLKRLYANLTPWETVLVARHPKRPHSRDYLRMIFRDFCELHGDRLFADDQAMITGFSRIGGHRVLFVGHSKGKDIKERMACNFGCAHPEGYRKSLHKMKLAEKYGLPVVCLIDTQGAYPGIGSEERGVAHAIAVNMMEMSRLRTPIVCVVIGEGGSGGALGIGVGDRVAMLQHSFYSVISPEGCAAILWKTADQRKHAAEALNLTSRALRKLNVIDDVINEPVGGAHRDPEATAANLEKYITGVLNALKKRTIDSLLQKRYERIRKQGCLFNDPQAGDTGPRVVRSASAKTSRGKTRRTTDVPSTVLDSRRVPS